MARSTPKAATIPTESAARAVERTLRWLLFVHQLPARPSNLRVRTWRRLQQLGAVAVRQAVYVLPDSPTSREDFEWLRAEIEASGGQANVFTADSVDVWSDDALIEEFRRSRQQAYRELALDAEQVLRRASARTRKSRVVPSRRLLHQLRERLSAIERVDFFSSAGRDRAISVLRHIEEHASVGGRGTTPAGAEDVPPSYKAQLWVTRPRPGVDRMASAWLIGRFIDLEARFGFVADPAAAPRGAIPYDMFGVDFSHRGEHCTFETLCEVFGITGAGVTRLAAIVHDLDIKDGRFGAPEASAVGAVIDGLQLRYADDDALLAQGIVLFDSLYRAFEQSVRRVGPRPVARTRATRRRSKRR